MNLFIVLLTYVTPIEIVDQNLIEHRAFLDTQYKEKRLIFSGPRNPRTGGVILARCKDRKELEAVLEKDPFKKNGVATYEIIEFTPVKYAAGFEKFINQ